MFKFKVGDPQQYDDVGNYIGVQDITEPTYYETLLVCDGYVECEHEVSAEHLRNRGYIEVFGPQDNEDEFLENEKESCPKIKRDKLIFHKG